MLTDNKKCKNRNHIKIVRGECKVLERILHVMHCISQSDNTPYSESDLPHISDMNAVYLNHESIALDIAIRLQSIIKYISEDSLSKYIDDDDIVKFARSLQRKILKEFPDIKSEVLKIKEGLQS